MDQKLFDASTLCSQLMALRTIVQQLEPEAANRPGRPGSGITAVTPHFNSLLERSRKVFSDDPGLLQSIVHIEPVQEIQERLSASYHQRTKLQVLAGIDALLATLEPYLRRSDGNMIADKIYPFISELDVIYQQAIPTGQSDLGWERLDRWKERVSHFLKENLSEKEAERLSGGSDPFIDLGDEIERCKNTLTALVEELEAHPAMAIKSGATTKSDATPDRGGPQLGPSLGAAPSVPDTVTFSWLWQKVPVKVWATVGTVLLTAFMAGAYLSSFPALRPIFALLPGYAQPVKPTLPPEKAEQLIEKVKDLIAAHNQRLQELQKQLLYEERLAGDHSLYSTGRETHRAAADKIREVIEKENENFRRELEALKRLYE